MLVVGRASHMTERHRVDYMDLRTVDTRMPAPDLYVRMDRLQITGWNLGNQQPPPLG